MTAKEKLLARIEEARALPDGAKLLDVADSIAAGTLLIGELRMLAGSSLNPIVEQLLQVIGITTARLAAAHALTEEQRAAATALSRDLLNLKIAMIHEESQAEEPSFSPLRRPARPEEN